MTIWNLLKGNVEADLPGDLVHTAALTTETNRAKAAEKVLEEANSSEITRAKAGEKTAEENAVSNAAGKATTGETNAVSAAATKDTTAANEAKAREKETEEKAIIAAAAKDTTATSEAKTREKEAQEKAEEKAKTAAEALKKKFTTEKSFSWKGELTNGLIIPGPSVLIEGTEVKKLIAVTYYIESGTEGEFELQRNGSGATGYTALKITKTQTRTKPEAITLADEDKFRLKVGTVSGAPTNACVTFHYQYTV